MRRSRTTLLRKMGVSCLPKHSKEVVIDLDASDDPLHGQQEGRFFHGFYGSYCYLPLFAFVGSVPLWAELRTSDGDAARGAVEALQKIVPAMRKRCPKARIIVRADSGFCREETHGLVRGSTTKGLLLSGAWLATAGYGNCWRINLLGFASWPFCAAGWRAALQSSNIKPQKSWTLSRRVIGKAEVLGDKDNPRFIVTNLSAEGFDRRPAVP